MKHLGSLIDRLKQGQGQPARHANPYLEEAVSLGNVLLTQKELIAQNYQIPFSQTHPYIIEIGCYMGKNLLEIAQRNPHFNFLGLDITYKRVVKTAHKLQASGLSNAKVALSYSQTFFESSLQAYENNPWLHGACVFFPDPWPKISQAKNRLLLPPWIKTLYQSLRPQGFFWFKTDSQFYFQDAHSFLLDAGFLEDSSLEPQEIRGGPYESAFQSLFARKGTPFFQKVYRKP